MVVSPPRGGPRDHGRGQPCPSHLRLWLDLEANRQRNQGDENCLQTMEKERRGRRNQGDGQIRDHLPPPNRPLESAIFVIKRSFPSLVSCVTYMLSFCSERKHRTCLVLLLFSQRHHCMARSVTRTKVSNASLSLFHLNLVIYFCK